jgi:hypothetical protein
MQTKIDDKIRDIEQQQEQQSHKSNNQSIDCGTKQMNTFEEQITKPERTDLATATAAAVTPLEDCNLLQHILLFVGDNQYRFVAATSKRFQHSYLQLFTEKKTTYVNAVSTVERAKVFIAECQRIRDTAGTPFLCNLAVSHESLLTLQYLHSAHFVWDVSTCNKAAAEGNLPILQYLHENKCPWDETTCHSAALPGHLHILQYLRAHGCPWDARTCAQVASGTAAGERRHKNFVLLQWAHVNGCPWDEMTCGFAAINGHLDMLQWAHANGCPWRSRTCAFAAYFGHLNVLRWAVANKCPWYPNEILEELSERNAHPEIVEWVTETITRGTEQRDGERIDVYAVE